MLVKPRVSVRALVIFAALLFGSVSTAFFAADLFNPNQSSLSHGQPVLFAPPDNNVLGIVCGYGASDPSQPFPVAITTKDGNVLAPGTVNSSCDWAGDVDGDGALDPLASDNPSLLPAGSGGGFIADIVVTNLNTSINGFDLTLNYDTRVLNAVLIDQSGLLYGGNNGCPNGNPLCTFSTALTIDRSIGEVRVVQALLAVTSGPGGNCNTTVNPNCVNANQELFRIRFDVVGAGKGFISFATNPLQNVIVCQCTPSAVPHTSQDSSFSTDSLFALVNGVNSFENGYNVSWTLSPSPEVPGSTLTFTAVASCGNCTAPFTYSWDFSSQDSATYSAKVDASGITATVTAPPPVINRVALNVSDSATPTHHWAISVARLPLVSGTSGLPALTQLSQGTAGGSWTAMWLGGIVTGTSGYSGQWTFCPGTPTVTTVCSNPKVAFTQNPSTPITQTMSMSGVIFNYAGLYNSSVQVSDTALSQIGPLPTTVTRFFLVNVTGQTPAYTVAVTPTRTAQVLGQLASFSISTTYAGSYPAGFRANSFIYQIDYGDGSTNTVTGGLSVPLITHTYNSAGIFQVKIVAQENGPLATTKIRESGGAIVDAVQQLLAGDFSLTPSSPTPGQTVTFAGTASGGAPSYTYSWNFGDGSVNSTGSSPTHIYSSAGSYNVTLTVTDSFGSSFVVAHIVAVGAQGVSPLVLAAGVIVAAAVVAGLVLFLRRRRATLSSAGTRP